jgi:hypothetical protein
MYKGLKSQTAHLDDDLILNISPRTRNHSALEILKINKNNEGQKTFNQVFSGAVNSDAFKEILRVFLWAQEESRNIK